MENITHKHPRCWKITSAPFLIVSWHPWAVVSPLLCHPTSHTQLAGNFPPQWCGQFEMASLCNNKCIPQVPHVAVPISPCCMRADAPIHPISHQLHCCTLSAPVQTKDRSSLKHHFFFATLLVSSCIDLFLPCRFECAFCVWSQTTTHHDKYTTLQLIRNSVTFWGTHHLSVFHSPFPWISFRYSQFLFAILDVLMWSDCGIGCGPGIPFQAIFNFTAFEVIRLCFQMQSKGGLGITPTSVQVENQKGRLILLSFRRMHNVSVVPEIIFIIGSWLVFTKILQFHFVRLEKIQPVPFFFKASQGL